MIEQKCPIYYRQTRKGSQKRHAKWLKKSYSKYRRSQWKKLGEESPKKQAYRGYEE